MPPQRPSPQDRRSGFALLITITLLAFLVLLLVSLASLTRVETQVASNNQQLSQARQNALMALNVALGRLQALAGPDQRITATADIVAGAHDDKRRWTGVWNTTAASPAPEWLVSSAAPASVSGTAAVATGLPALGTVPLVSNNTVDTTLAGNAVTVETQPITAAVAGISGTPVVGNFAYWVGDEGVKAKVSLGDPWKSATSGGPVLTATGVTTTDAGTFSFFAAQRSGIEGVSATDLNNAATTNKLNADYPASTDAAFRNSLPKILSLPQLPVSHAPGATRLGSAIKTRFHDLTASSYSVLSDVTAGGLKRDLTAWIGRPSDSPLSSDLIPSASSIVGGNSYSLPKWGIIRSYAKLVADGSPKLPFAQSDEQQSLFPVMTFGRLGLATSCEGAGSPLKLNLFPHLVLWNPTSIPITGEFQFCIGFPYNPQAAFRLGPGPGAPAASVPAKLRIYMGAVSLTGPAGTPSLPYDYFRFIVKAPIEGILPGQSLAFTLNSSGPYVRGTNVMEANNPNRKDNSVTIDGETMSAAELTQNVYCNVASGNMDLLLCPNPVPAAIPASPTSAELIACAYQAARVGDGFGTPGTVIPSGPAQPAATILAPVMDYRLSMNFSRNRSYTENPRWLASLNPRSALLLRKRSYFCFTVANPYAEPPAVSGNENSAADGVDPAVLGSTVVKPILFEFQPAGVPLFSLAQLQHASLSLISLNPAYAAGNAIADYYVDRDQLSKDIGADPYGVGPLTRIYDLSYLLNQALWDRYFFSTVPSSLISPLQLTADYHLPNSRHKFHWRSDAGTEFNELKTTDTAASHLLVNGGFNINSTSIQAWRALLYSHNTPPDPATPDDKHPFSRFSRPLVGTTPNSTWQGHRVLTDAQLDNLAANIVAQVKARGPFLSLADFVNRRLVDVASTTEDERLKGTLQAAMDAIDAGSTSSYANNVNFRAPFRSTDTAYRILSGVYPNDGYPTGSTSEQKEKFRGGPDASAPYASMAAGAPGFLTQADLLGAIGPVLSARSDTFTIRAYGDVMNPAAGGTTPDARAWCEAVVQRLPDYVEGGVDAWSSPATGTPSATFGRRFKIVSFRWLSAGDI